MDSPILKDSRRTSVRRFDAKTNPQRKVIKLEQESAVVRLYPERGPKLLDRGETILAVRAPIRPKLVRSPLLILRSIVTYFLRLIDRPGLEFIALRAARIVLWVRERRLPEKERLILGREYGAWFSRQGERYLVHRKLNLDLHPDEAISREADNLFHRYQPRQGDVVVCAGAGTGMAAMASSMRVGEIGRVYAIEPHPLTYKALKLTCRLNNLTNVLPRKLAVSNSNGITHIEDNSCWRPNSIMTGRGSIRADAITLDHFVMAERIKVIDLLLMNIEGAEREAIRGMAEMLKRVKHVCICCHDFRADRGDGEIMRTQSLVAQYLRAHGFRTYFRLDDERPSVRCNVYAENIELVPQR